MKELGFEKTWIYRPGLLQRGDLSRWNEKIFSWFSPSLCVKDMASVMVGDYLAYLEDTKDETNEEEDETSPKPRVNTLEDGTIKGRVVRYASIRHTRRTRGGGEEEEEDEKKETS